MSKVLGFILHNILLSCFLIEAALKAGLPVKMAWYWK